MITKGSILQEDVNIFNVYMLKTVSNYMRQKLKEIQKENS